MVYPLADALYFINTQEGGGGVQELTLGMSRSGAHHREHHHQPAARRPQDEPEDGGDPADGGHHDSVGGGGALLPPTRSTTLHRTRGKPDTFQKSQLVHPYPSFC